MVENEKHGEKVWNLIAHSKNFLVSGCWTGQKQGETWDLAVKCYKS